MASQNQKVPCRYRFKRLTPILFVLLCVTISGIAVGIFLWTRKYSVRKPEDLVVTITSAPHALTTNERSWKAPRQLEGQEQQEQNNYHENTEDLSLRYQEDASSLPVFEKKLQGNIENDEINAVDDAGDDNVFVSTPSFWDVTSPKADEEKYEFSPYLVGAYYYPWHKNNFHNHEGYVRKELQPKPQVPFLGEYDDSRPEIISQHLNWSRQANIGLWVNSWWGPNHVTDQTTRNVIMEHSEIGNFKIALHYETNGRLGRNDYDLKVAESDIEYLCDHYFGHPMYYRVDGGDGNDNKRPVLFLYLARALDRLDLLASVILTMKRAASRQCGEDLYIVGDHVFSDSPDPSSAYDSFMYLDAVTSYDVYGSMGRPSGYAGSETVNRYHAEQTNWRRVAHLSGCRYIPAVSPGYNDRGVRIGANHPALSRRLTENAEEGSLFGYQITLAKELVDPSIDNLIMVNSFNEWHEDTQIEPVVGNVSSEPFNLTEGLEYVAYNDLYLNILRFGTIERLGNMFNHLDNGGR